MDNLTKDLRFGLRQLRRTPVFTVTVVLSLALGIGAAVTMFSAFRAVFLRPLPYRDTSQLVFINKKPAQSSSSDWTTLADFQFLREHARCFQEIAYYGNIQVQTLTGITNPATLWVRSVSPNLFQLLGSRPLLGRTLTASDFKQGSPPAILLAYTTWQKYFHGDPGVLERPVFLDGESYRVVGVMPKEFIFPRLGTAAWLPERKLVANPVEAEEDLIARLKPGMSIEQTNAQLRQIVPALAKSYRAKDRHWLLFADGVANEGILKYRTAFRLLLTAVGFLVLIACLNVGSLLLARATAREGEFNTRAALGAGQWRLFRQVLTESFLLASIGGACGLLFAYGGNRLLVWLLPERLLVPRLNTSHLDLQVLLVAVLLTGFTGLLFGSLPAIALSRSRLHESARQRHSSSVPAWRYQALLSLEVALSVILLSGAVLMVRSFSRLMSVDPGFLTTRVVTATIPARKVTSLNNERVVQRYRDLLPNIQRLAGVEKAAISTTLPMDKLEISTAVYIPNRSCNPCLFQFRSISPDYFAALGTPLERGRFFKETDDDPHSPGVIIINQALAQKYWPNSDPVGQRISMQSAITAPELTIIGVVANTRYRDLSGAPVPEAYRPYGQYLGPAVGTSLVVHTIGDPRSVETSIRQAVRRFDPEQVIENVTTMEARVETSVATPRFYTLLLTVFAALAVLETFIGVYGVASYSVSRRTREMGIRMALGAERVGLILMILRQGSAAVLIGMGAGLVGAWMLARFMTSMVYGIDVEDPVSAAVAIMILLLGALFAYFLPARRTTAIDPASVLRVE